MARLVAAFGSSHSPMLASRIEDWQSGFLARDQARQFVDLDGNACNYTELLARAPADALQRIAPEHLTLRHGEAMAAMTRLRDDVAAAKLDALIIVGDDQEELFHHDNMPAIGIYYGDTIRGRLPYQQEVREADYPCHAGLARHLIASLQQDGFDLSVMRSLAEGQREGHAYSFAHRFYLTAGAVPIVPVFLNAYYPPNQPAPARCLALGEALQRGIEQFPQDARIGVMASGGLSHFVVDEAFDRALIEALRRKDGNFFRDAPLTKLQSGSSEIRNWICLAGASMRLDLAWASYVPGYRTPALSGTGLCFASFR
jgi:catalytic LigB subunit of aromatic ring-opening dioxygenase